MLAGLVDIRRGEGSRVAPVAALGFVVISAQVLATIASDTIFVTAFTLGQLSGFIAVASLVRVMLIFGYGAIARRQGTRGAAVLLGGMGAFTAALGGLVTARAPWVVYGVCVALLVVPVAAAEAVSEATETFPARQGKRLGPLVGGCSTIGGMAAGGAARALAPRLGAPSLLWLAGALLVVGALVSAGMPSRPSPERRGGAASRADSKGGGSATHLGRALSSLVEDWRSIPIVRVAVLLGFLVAAANSTADFLYKATLKATFARDQMAAYVGTVEVVLSACVITAQLFVTARLASRIGLRGTLRIHPIALAVVGPAFGVVPGVATATAAKVVESFGRFSIFTPLRPSLLAPVEPRARARASLLARGAAGSLGGVVVGVLLAAFGAAGPPAWVLGALLLVIAIFAMVVLSGAGKAHAAALARALGEGRLSFEVPAATASSLASGLRGVLRDSIATGDAKRAARVLGLMGDRQLSFDDVADAARSDSPELYAAAARAAIRVAKPGDGERLLALLPPREDDAVEKEILACARKLGVVDRARVESALARPARASVSTAALELKSEALISLAQVGDTKAADELMSLATAGAPGERAVALRAFEEVTDGEGPPSLRGRPLGAVSEALASKDRQVFAAASATLAAWGDRSSVAALVGHVLQGPHFGPAARALVVLGEEASMQPLLAALSASPVAGSLRAAHVLARLGPRSCAMALAAYEGLGHRAREAVAESLATMADDWRAAIPSASVDRAVRVTLEAAEALLEVVASRSGLFGRERRLRIARAAQRVLDLATIKGDRSRIAKARAALVRTDRARADALELLEHVLPKAFAKRTVALLEAEGALADGPPSVAATRPAGDEPAALDAWLQTCRRFDRGELASPEMLALLEKLIVLGESSLFEGMTSEELHPVGEIAEPVDLDPGDVAVRQGDPGDAIFVIAEGTLAVTKDGLKLKEVGRGSVFGEVALLDGGPRSASVEAVTRTRLLRIPRAEFEALIDQHPEIARGIIRTLLAHLRGSG